ETVKDGKNQKTVLTEAEENQIITTFNDQKAIDEATYQERISRSQPYPGDLIITREAPMGEVCIIPDGIECCLGQRLVLIKPNLNKINNKYLLYALLSEYTQKQIQQSNNTGSIVSNLRIPLLKNLDIPLNNNQDKIAAVLSYLDDKIEINNRINSELENLAKTIYDYWFVQFDFPDENGKPYKSSGGKMVYNQELKREIPAGWEVKKLSNIADITMGQSPDGESYNEDKKGEIFFQGSTDFGWRFPTIRQYTTQPSRMAKKGDILLSVRAPVGTLNIADNDCCIGRGLAALRSKSGFNSYLFYVMEYFKKTFDHRNNIGTTFGSITKDDLFNLKLVYPDKEHLKKYELIVSKYNQLILNNHLQNQQLTQLRDWLLPMLMNGQITVK
ncbi:MAG: restriction endonuclease subunit S, partial [Dolichospermum sp.]